MKKVMDKMMLSCRQATLLMEKGADAPLTLGERLKLKFHTSMCSGCTNYQKQTKLIQDLVKSHFGNSTQKAHAPVDIQQLKTTILNSLK